MAYLRGNTVVDGNLFVEGSLIYSGARPDDLGSVGCFKEDGQGVVVGRHLMSSNPQDGALRDSSVREVISETTYSTETRKNVNLYFDVSNSSTPLDNDESCTGTPKVNTVIINYPVAKFFIIDKPLIPFNFNSSDAPADYDEIDAWTYNFF